MPDPLTLATVITTAIFAGLGLIINIFQSIKMEHFSMTCSDCCSLDNKPCDKSLDN